MQSEKWKIMSGKIASEWYMSIPPANSCNFNIYSTPLSCNFHSFSHHMICCSYVRIEKLIMNISNFLLERENIIEINIS